MNRKLSTMSSTQSVTLSALATRMLPSHFSIEAARLFICMSGTASEKMRK